MASSKSQTRRTRRVALWAAVVLGCLAGVGRAAPQGPMPRTVPPPGWVSLFDGATLERWDGRQGVWRVEAGAITGEVAHGPSSVTDTTYLLWKGGEVRDFDLQAEVRADGRFVNTGVVYRGFVIAPGRAGANTPYKLGGPQLDFDAAGRYGGQFFEVAAERPLRATRGQLVERRDAPELVGSVGDPATLGRAIRIGDWNQLRIIAHGRTLTHLVNGHVMAVVIDRGNTFRPAGLLALQLEGAGRVRFRNLWLRAE